MNPYKPINIPTTLLVDSAQLTGTFSSPKPPGTACGEEPWKIHEQSQSLNAKSVVEKR